LLKKEHKGKEGIIKMTKLILKRQLSKNKKKGFTLIELIVVIVIIAIIAAIAVPALTRYIQNANVRAAQAQAHNIQVVLQAEVTEFYEYTINGDLNGGTAATDATGLFQGTQPTLPGGVAFPTTINAVLAYNGVNIGSGDLIGITFDGKRLQAFTYIHNADITIEYEDGIFDPIY